MEWTQGLAGTEEQRASTPVGLVKRQVGPVSATLPPDWSFCNGRCDERDGRASEVGRGALVNAYVAGGSKHAILPSDSKIKIIGLLTQMMVDPALAATYCQALEWEVNQRGSTVETAWLHRIGLEIREEEIAARGFVGLTDDELADIALSPAAIQALADDFINDPDTKLGAGTLRH